MSTLFVLTAAAVAVDCSSGGEKGFSCRGAQLEGVWSAIPEGVDILLTHMPPFNRLDLAFDRGSHAKVDPCPVCGETHRG